MDAAGTSYQCRRAFFGICGSELILLAWWNVVTCAHETYLQSWRKSIKRYQSICHLTCSGPWCKPGLLSWCLPQLLVLNMLCWDAGLLLFPIAGVMYCFCWLLESSGCFPSGWAAWCFFANLLLAMMLSLHILLEANGCGKPYAAFSCRDQGGHPPRLWWHDVHPRPLLSTSRIKHHQASRLIKKHILHAPHIISYNIT